MPKSGPSSHPAGLIEEIAEKIHARIISGDYKPGERLKQDLLAEEFGVSRTPIREALSKLDARGIVRLEMRRSATVSVPSPREVREMYQVRAELEGLAAELAAEWINDAKLRALEAAHEAFVKAATKLRAAKTARSRESALPKLSLDWIGTNEVFHQCIVEASGNSALARVLREVSAGYVRNLMLSSAAETNVLRMESNVASHAAILAAIREHDPARARAAMVGHIREGGDFVAAWFERRQVKS
ncbi:MAG: pdhR 2 [Rubritepida sp.]|nr:pdhR 2 [Rubritepida sp.]